MVRLSAGMAVTLKRQRQEERYIQVPELAEGENTRLNDRLGGVINGTCFSQRKTEAGCQQ